MLERGFEFAPGYRLEVFLGRGQFGQVWQVTAPGGTTAAVKFIDLAEGQWEKEYEGIRRVKQIRHANLMPIIAIWLLDADGKVLEETAPDSQEALDTVDLEDTDRSGDWVLSHQGRERARWLAVAMLLGGKNLLQRLKECKEEGSSGIPAKELLSYMEESAKGLDFLNSRVHDFGSGTTSLQHCDIKPANIVLIGSSAVICDFGLARLMARDQVTATSVAGTPAYMAPEAIGGKPSRTSDQYSLAITYYQLRTGKLPLSDGSLWEVLDAHRLGNLRFDDIPEREQAVLHRATSLEWEKRFDSNQEMVEALRESLRIEATLPALPAAASPTSRWRYGLIAAVAAALLLPITIYLWPTPEDEAVVALGPHRQEERELSAEATDGDPQNETDTAADPQRVQAALAAVDEDEPRAKALFEELLDVDPAVAQLTPTLLVGHRQEVLRSQIIGKDENVLVTAAAENQLRRFDLEQLGKLAASGQRKDFAGTALDGHTNLVEVLAVAKDRRWCASGGYDSNVLIWDAQSNTGEPSAVLSEHQDDITAIAWHPSKPFLITASADSKIGIWNLKITNDSLAVNASKSKIFRAPQAIDQLAFDLWGESLICRDVAAHALGTFSWEAIERYLRLGEKPQMETLSSPGALIRTFCLADTPDADTRVISGEESGEIGFWSLRERTLIARKEGHDHPVIVCKVQGKGEQQTVVSGDDHGGLFLWKGDQPGVSLPGHSDIIYDVELSSDGRWLAVASGDGTVTLRDLHNDPLQFTSIAPAERPRFETVQLDPSGRWLFAGGSDGRLYAWDLRRAKLLVWTRPTKETPPVETPPDEDTPEETSRPNTGLVT